MNELKEALSRLLRGEKFVNVELCNESKLIKIAGELGIILCGGALHGKTKTLYVLD